MLKSTALLETRSILAAACLAAWALAAPARAQRRPEPNTALPARQHASDDSLRRRLEIANRRNRELVDVNQRVDERALPRREQRDR